VPGALFALIRLVRDQARPEYFDRQSVAICNSRDGASKPVPRSIYDFHATASLDNMTTIREKAGTLWHMVLGVLRNRRETAPIDNVAKLQDFVATRSAYLAQKTLYSYVKTRMGIRYPAMFEDKNIIASLNIAKLHVFAACLSDLTIYAVAIGLRGQPIGNGEREELARRCYKVALAEIIGAAPEQFSVPDYVGEFDRRLADTDWQHGALQPENFTRSSRALVRWAPIEDELKKFDSEIIENSVKYAWRDIREQYRKRINVDAIGADWSRQTA
jgi:hypothetical protein